MANASENGAERDYTLWKDKAATDLQERFPAWLMDKVGIDPNQYRTKEQAFRDGVRLAVALRIPFQASPENKAATAERAASREAAEPAAPAKKATKAAKAAVPAATPAKATPKGRGARKAAPNSPAAF